MLIYLLNFFPFEGLENPRISRVPVDFTRGGGWWEWEARRGKKKGWEIVKGEKKRREELSTFSPRR